jgi:hypothetical protein
MLDAHSEVAIAPETFFMRHFWERRRSYGDLQVDAHHRRLLEDLVATPAFREMGLAEEEFRRRAGDASRGYAALFDLLLRGFAEARGARVVGEKTPNHLFSMRTLELFFPEARFVHLVRDPRAVACSWRQVPWSTGSLCRDANVWRRYQAAARRRAPRRRESLYTLRYEQLVRAPVESLEPLCRFLDLDFEPGMLDYAKPESPTLDLEREPWKAAATQPPDPDRLTRWRTQLAPEEVREIEAVVLFEMRRARYPTENSSLSLLLGMPGARTRVRLLRLRSRWKRWKKRRRRA